MNNQRLDEMFQMGGMPRGNSPPYVKNPSSAGLPPLPPIELSPAQRMANSPMRTGVPLAEIQRQDKMYDVQRQYVEEEDDRIANAWASQMRPYRHQSPQQSYDEDMADTMLYDDGVDSIPRSRNYRY